MVAEGRLWALRITAFVALTGLVAVVSFPGMLSSANFEASYRNNNENSMQIKNTTTGASLALGGDLNVTRKKAFIEYKPGTSDEPATSPTPGLRKPDIVSRPTNATQDNPIKPPTTDPPKPSPPKKDQDEAVDVTEPVPAPVKPSPPKGAVEVADKKETAPAPKPAPKEDKKEPAPAPKQDEPALTAAPVHDPMDYKGPLDSLYNTFLTDSYDGGKVSDLYYHFLKGKAGRVYPNLNFRRIQKKAPYISTPALARNQQTGAVVMGVRVQVLGFSSALMLCDIRLPLDASTCQDSGLSYNYIPPECDAEEFRKGHGGIMHGIAALGPEDSRLIFDGDNLRAVFMHRGCHNGTEYNERRPSFSIAYVDFNKTSTKDQWQMIGHHKTMELRERNGALPSYYPAVTKSWIPMPYKNPSEQQPHLYFGFGWSTNMRRNFILEVKDFPTETVALAKPLTDFSIGRSKLDLKNRGSTTVVPFGDDRTLFGVGHYRYQKSGYLHFWYAMCSTPPFEMIGYGPHFKFHSMGGVWMSFALGLAVEDDFAYVSFSEDDKVPELARYKIQDVVNIVKNFTQYDPTVCERGG